MSNLAALLGDGDGPAVGGHGIIVARRTTGDISVGREGEVVTLQIGKSVLRFTYKDAMKIGQWILTKATEAKCLASDTKRILVEKR